MQAEHPTSRAADRHSEIANLIRESYPDLQKLLNSPYVDGAEIYHCLVSLGHDLSRDSPENVSEALGWWCMRLPAVSIDGKPKHYLPVAVGAPQYGAWNISEQAAACVANLREFGRST